MAHHKRRRPKHQRAGCLMCKPWKDNRRKGLAPRKAGRYAAPVKPSVARRLQPDLNLEPYYYDEQPL